MFKKQATYKPSAAIRNQERKGLIAEVKQIFSSAFAGKDEEQVKDMIDQVLPSSGIEAATFTSTKGHRGTLYSHTDVPLFIRYQERLVPTLQTLWSCPSLVTTALTGSQVLANLQAGSDLMVKGMFDYSPNVKKGDVVAILVSDKSHPVAVGLAALDFAQIDREAGGKGILLVSFLGDSITPIASYPLESSSTERLSQAISEVDLQDSSGPDQHDAANHDVGEWPELRTEEVDEAFIRALLYGLYNLHIEGDDVPLPMPSSTLIDVHVLPYLPSYNPDLTLKKTSWKKASKFLAKQKILKCKDTKGQLSITGIDWTSPLLASFTPYTLPASSQSAQSQQAPKEQSQDALHTLQIEEFYSLPSKFSVLIDSSHEQAHYTRDALSGLLDAYYDKESLRSPTNKKMITIDPNLSHLLVSSSNAKKQELSKDVLLKSLIKASQVHHRVNGGKLKKGQVPDLLIVMESRQGRKSVTRITHLERFFEHDQVDSIVDEMKRKCAVSVSVGEVKGTKPGSSVELTVQGKKAVEAQEVLEKWGVKKSMIKVEDKTK